MATLLHLDASARRAHSLSRRLSRRFVDEWLNRRPTDAVIYRDLAANPPPVVTEAWIAAVFTAPEQRTPEQKDVVRASDELIDELERADLIVMGTPMYNYGMPAVLKAWFDQIIRIDKTFSFDLARGDWPLEPILTGKRLVRTCARYLGVYDDHVIAVEYQEFGGERHEASVAAADAAVPVMVARLAAAIAGSARVTEKHDPEPRGEAPNVPIEALDDSGRGIA